MSPRELDRRPSGALHASVELRKKMVLISSECLWKYLFSLKKFVCGFRNTTTRKTAMSHGKTVFPPLHPGASSLIFGMRQRRACRGYVHRYLTVFRGSKMPVTDMNAAGDTPGSDSALEQRRRYVVPSL